MIGWLFVAYLLGAGGYTAYRLRFFCFLHPVRTVRMLFSAQKPQHTDGRAARYTPFGALTVALAGTLGVGNITGVAAAILLGGSGALFWMWVSALCTMLIKYAEVYLAVRTRQTLTTERGSEYRGGPMRYLRLLPGGGALAAVFCLLCVAASAVQGNLLQSCAVLSGVTRTFSVPVPLAAAALGICAAVLMFGGRRAIASFTERMIPLMTALYLVMGLTVIVRNAEMLPSVFSDIFKNAFSLRAAAGGTPLMLAAMRHGCAKGVFSHEAGCGTAPISHAGAETDSAARQGLLGIAEVFVDTIVLCTVTGLVLLLSGVCGGGSDRDYTAVVLEAFSVWFGDAAAVFLTVSIVFYAFATLVCWSFYGTECIRALLADCGDTAVRRGVTVYLALYTLTAVCGAAVAEQMLWRLSDFLTMTMTALNTTGVMVLMGNVKIPEIRR